MKIQYEKILNTVVKITTAKDFPKCADISSTMESEDKKKKCAYKHAQSENKTNLNKQIKQGLLKHEMDIKLLNEEVHILRNLVQCIALELSKNVSKKASGIETNELENWEEAKDAHCEIKDKCEKCEFTCDKVITLNKHMNTKHMQGKVQNYTDNKMENTEKFLCDKCQLSFKKKKDLTKHIDSAHQISEGSNELGNKSSINENKNSACNCTHDTVCDYCLEADGFIEYKTRQQGVSQG